MFRLMFRPLLKFADTRGRASRAEYWYFYLFFFVSIAALALTEVYSGMTGGNEDGILMLLFQLSMLIPIVALNVRRLHDIGHSGWWALLQFVPLVSIGQFFYLGFRAGAVGSNRFGPDPRWELDMPDAEVFA